MCVPRGWRPSFGSIVQGVDLTAMKGDNNGVSEVIRRSQEQRDLRALGIFLQATNLEGAKVSLRCQPFPNGSLGEAARLFTIENQSFEHFQLLIGPALKSTGATIDYVFTYDKRAYLLRFEKVDALTAQGIALSVMPKS